MAKIIPIFEEEPYSLQCEVCGCDLVRVLIYKEQRIVAVQCSKCNHSIEMPITCEMD